MVGVYDPATSVLLSVQSAASPVAPGLGVRALPPNGVAFVTHGWDEGTADWAPLPGTTVRYVLSRGDWMARVGAAHEIALRMAMLDPAMPLQLRAQLHYLDAELTRRADVDVRHPNAAAGAAGIADALVSIGRLQQNARDDFVAMLLEPVAES
jgi:hypothetical protein